MQSSILAAPDLPTPMQSFLNPSGTEDDSPAPKLPGKAHNF